MTTAPVLLDRSGVGFNPWAPAPSVDAAPTFGRGASFEDRNRWRAVQRGYSTVLAQAMLAVLPAADPLTGGLLQTLSCRSVAAVNVTDGPLQSMSRAPGEVPARAIAFNGCCRQRWCSFCWGVRASEIRARLVRLVGQWSQSDVWFVTLTEPNVDGDALRLTMRGMTARLRACVLAVRRAGVDVALVRRNEVTYNSETRDYHPHLHLMVRGQVAARMIRREWLDRTPAASSLAQDCQRADPRRLMRELTKYVVKPMATGRDGGTTKREYWPADAMVTIYRALARLRLFAVVGVEEQDAEQGLEEELDALERAAGADEVPREWLRDAAAVIPEDVTGLRFLEWDPLELCWRSGPLRLGDGAGRAGELVREYADALRSFQEAFTFQNGGSG